VSLRFTSGIIAHGGGSVAKLYASDFGKRIVEKESFVALLRWVSCRGCEVSILTEISAEICWQITIRR